MLSFIYRLYVYLIQVPGLSEVEIFGTVLVQTVPGGVPGVYTSTCTAVRYCYDAARARAHLVGILVFALARALLPFFPLTLPRLGPRASDRSCPERLL